LVVVVGAVPVFVYVLPCMNYSAGFSPFSHQGSFSFRHKNKTLPVGMVMIV
jgi:hypothetical protein